MDAARFGGARVSGRPSIFITGAAAGIGRATAEWFAARGWFVGAYDVNEAGVRELAQKFAPDGIHAGRLDVIDGEAFAQALSTFFAVAGNRLDLLFNNAGIASTGNFEALPLRTQQAIVDVNFKGVINGCHAAFPFLKQTPNARVVNMCSASAIYGSPGLATYSATKFGVRGFSEALDIEWQAHGIRVSDILPLFVDTAMVAKFEADLKAKDVLGMHLTPGDIAQTVWRIAHWNAWRRVHWYPGWQSWLLAFLQKLSPSWMNRWSTKVISGY